MASLSSDLKFLSCARACRRLAIELESPVADEAPAELTVLDRITGHLDQAAEQLIALTGADLAHVPPWLAENVLATTLGTWHDEDGGEAPSDPTPNEDHQQVLRATGGFAEANDLISFLSSMQRTGLLEIVTATERFELEFVDGDIVHAQSDHAPEGARLGDILVRQGAVVRSEVDVMLEMEPDKPLGLALWKSWLVTREQLLDALEEQIRLQFERMSELPAQQFTFWSGPPLRAQDEMRMNAMKLILDGARAADERGRTS